MKGLLLLKCLVVAAIGVVGASCGSGNETVHVGNDFTIERPGMFYEVTCVEEDGVSTYAATVFTNGLPGSTYKSQEIKGTCGAIEVALRQGRLPLAAKDRLAKAAVPQVQPSLYLLDQANLEVQTLDLPSFNLTQVDLPGGNKIQYPTSMDITPDGSTIWVTQLPFLPNNAGIAPMPPLVSIFNTAQRAFTGSFPLPTGISPNTIQFSTDGTAAYITNDGAPSGGSSGVPANSSILVVNVATHTVATTIPTPKGAGDAAVSPDGLLLYTIGANFGLGSNNLTVVDATTNSVATSIALPDGGVNVFVNPTGTRLYVLWVRGIDVFDTATLQEVASIPAQNTSLSNFAYFTPDGATAMICGCGYGKTYVVDVRTSQLINTIQTSAHGFAFGTP